MAGRIPQSFIDDLLARVNVLDIVEARVKLKRTGKNYSGLCPFHKEKSPSFTVNNENSSIIVLAAVPVVTPSVFLWSMTA